ncbi:ATP-binding cassette domain-containing protein [bacterium]|nr:ATP-binding cassette domain-containing protein [bacterium]
MQLLNVDQLTKTFPRVPAVRGVSFSVSEGEVVAVLGPNGAGKSTTLRMIAGYLEPDSGDAEIAGFSIRREAMRARSRLGYLPEGAPLYLDLTPHAFLAFIARLHGLHGPAGRSAVERVEADARLSGVMDRTIETLSKGYRRRVAIAAAILHDPPVLVLDEPTDGLDPNQKVAMRALIRRMAERKAIVISTHQFDEVEAMCPRVVLIHRGSVVADETSAALAGRTLSGRIADAFHALTADGEAA